jgi:membrane-associated protease RseP (regulator of RpoE activity)
MMEKIIDFLKYKMDIEDITTGLNFTKVIGTIHSPISKTIGEIKEYCTSTEYTPLFAEDKGRHIVQFGIFSRVEDNPKYWLNILLFLATILSTIFAGSLNSGGNPFRNLSDILLGIPFSFSIMAILTCHELGHYFVSRRAGMITTLPYFIPIPFHFLGTFGAVIRMKSIVPSRKILLRVGMAGPLAGFLVAIPITIIGIALSEINIAPEGGGSFSPSDGFCWMYRIFGDLIEFDSNWPTRWWTYCLQCFITKMQIFKGADYYFSCSTWITMAWVDILGTYSIFPSA